MKKKREIQVILDSNDWAVATVVNNVKENIHNFDICKQKKAQIRCKRIVHYASFPEFYRERKKLRMLHYLGNTIIVTCFHIVDGNSDYNTIVKYDRYVDVWHTSCRITQNKMINMGIQKEKIQVIPIPVNSNIFNLKYDEQTILQIQKQIKIPLGYSVIGSFQKDGNGWGEGMEPKLIKGPDLFCDAVEQIAKKTPVFVLLSGPARGYVKNRLEKANIPYSHVYFNESEMVANLYKFIDIYIMASREEGGPMSVLESMASGVPIVATRVGQAPDIIESGKNGVLVDIGDVQAIATAAEKILTDKEYRESLIAEGLKTVPRFDAKNAARKYEKQLYTIGE